MLGGRLSSTIALRQLAREIVLAGGDLALQLVAPGAEQVGPGLDRVLPAPVAVDLELRPPSVRRRDGRRSVPSRPRASRRRPGRGSGRPRGAARARRGTRRPRPRRGRRRSVWRGSARRRPPATGTGSRSAAAAGCCGRSGGAGLAGAVVVRVLTPGRYPLCVASGRTHAVDTALSHRKISARAMGNLGFAHRVNTAQVNSSWPRSSGVQLHITSLPGGRLGPDAYRFIDWLAAAGQSWWQVLPLGPPDRYRSPYKSQLGVRGLAAGCWRRRGRRCRAAEMATSATARPFWIGDWERFARRGARRRPGPVRARVGGAAGVRGASAGVRMIGRHRDLRVAGERRPPRSSRAVSATAFVAGAPPDAYSRHGPAVGQPAVRLAGAAAPRLPLVGRARAAHARRCSTWPGSTTSAASSPTGRCPPGARTAVGGRWRRGPGRALFDGAGRLARRRSAAGRRGPRRDHAGGRAAARRARAARDARAPVRLRSARGPRSPHRLENHVGAPGRLHGHPRPGHDPRLVSSRWPAPRRAFVDADAGPVWVRRAPSRGGV